MARDWSEERWIKVFLVDSARWLSMPWQARGLYGLLQRAADRDGIIDTGPDVVGGVAVMLRADQAELRGHLETLVAAGLVVMREQGIELPEHAAQQSSRASGAARQREYRRRVTESDAVVSPRHERVTQSDAVVTAGDAVVTSSDAVVTTGDARRHLLVTRSDDQKEENRREEKRVEEKAPARAGARERARVAASTPAPIDPRAKRLALALAAHPKFAPLDASAAASELLGGLGTLAFALDGERIDAAVAQAAAEAESGATERRLRQVLGWKLKDATKVRPQGADERLAEDVARIQAQVERDQAERDAVAVDYDDDAPF